MNEFSLNNSETVEAVTLAFCKVNWIFIRDIRDKFGIPNLTQSPAIGKNSEGSVPIFGILINPL